MQIFEFHCFTKRHPLPVAIQKEKKSNAIFPMDHGTLADFWSKAARLQHLSEAAIKQAERQ
ncbi:hypothetical protein [Stutzerimonas stutzeri]|uniref:hypothetical protein n=1 Tax=Stutzerimonas stutzeri TaxID=316 RepID=UPI00210AE567|nr:hypothetical protein [Stutzerimonas stutzeri]MCQ4257598.1 hypothetical protein [Stutzerimonas stutzeri]